MGLLSDPAKAVLGSCLVGFVRACTTVSTVHLPKGSRGNCLCVCYLSFNHSESDNCRLIGLFIFKSVLVSPPNSKLDMDCTLHAHT